MADRLPCYVAAAFVFLMLLNLGPAFLKPGDIDLYMMDLVWQDSRTEIGQSSGGGQSNPAPTPVATPTQHNTPASQPNGHDSVENQPTTHIPTSKDRDVSRAILPLVDEAEARVKAVKELLKGFRGPVIVGGIGDSGTRGVAELLMHFGTTMGDDHMLNSAHDSMYFHHVYSVKLLNSKKPKKTSYLQIGYQGLTSAHSFIYSRKSMRNFYGPLYGDEKWYSGVQWVASMLSNHYKYYTEKFPALSNTSNPHHDDMYWGFKHPRTFTMLPLFEAVLEQQFKLIHVIRDGRDIALGDNRGMMKVFCERIFNAEQVSSGYCNSKVNRHKLDQKFANTTMNNLRFWARANLEVIKWARGHLDSSRYLIIRTEDLVNGKVECFERVQNFLYAPDDSRRLPIDGIRTIAHHYSKFNSSYNGNKYRDDVRKEVTKSVLKVPEAVEAMKLFGYSLKDRMGTTNGCSDIPGA